MTISIVTCTYNTGAETLARTWASLKAQTFTDWEWVIYDDSPNMDTYNQAYGFCSDERYKVRIYRPHVPSGGNIGYVKRCAFGLGLGEILVELDHDDELTTDCLERVSLAFSDSDVGFVYSDWCEITPSGFSGKYPDGWGFGYGDHYWDEQHQVWAMKAPELNRTTMSHIVAAPNHVRAWRASAYHAIGGHNPAYQIADDYELCVRTVLGTKVAYIPKMLYKQHIGDHTAQRQRNGLIQTLVAEISNTYSDKLDELYGINRPVEREGMAVVSGTGEPNN